MIYRNGLQESLEEYAARFGLRVDLVRTTWRAQGLNQLAAAAQPLEYWVQHGCAPHPFRVLPGVAVPTSNGPCVFGDD